MIALTHVQVLRGSHHLGRITHKPLGGQLGADLERVEHVMKVKYTRNRFITQFLKGNTLVLS